MAAKSRDTGGSFILNMETIEVAIELPSEIVAELRKRAKLAKMPPERLLSLWIAKMAREVQQIRRDSDNYD